MLICSALATADKHEHGHNEQDSEEESIEESEEDIEIVSLGLDIRGNVRLLEPSRTEGIEKGNEVEINN